MASISNANLNYVIFKEIGVEFVGWVNNQWLIQIQLKQEILRGYQLLSITFAAEYHIYNLVA